MHAIAKSTETVSLKKVEELLAYSESIPFDFPEDTEVLKNKRQVAKQWLEKLKKSFSSKTRTAIPRGSNRGASGDNTGTCDDSVDKASQDKPDKMKLTDIRVMLAEGETLFKDTDENRTQKSSGNSASSRELNKVYTVVEAAEEWLEQVR